MKKFSAMLLAASLMLGTANLVMASDKPEDHKDKDHKEHKDKDKKEEKKKH